MRPPVYGRRIVQANKQRYKSQNFCPLRTLTQPSSPSPLLGRAPQGRSSTRVGFQPTVACCNRAHRCRAPFLPPPSQAALAARRFRSARHPRRGALPLAVLGTKGGRGTPHTSVAEGEASRAARSPRSLLQNGRYLSTTRRKIPALV
jgi:hypothetical protein